MGTRVEKRYVKMKISDQGNDFAYWQSQPYELRLAALEEIRKEYHRWKYRAEPRLESLSNR